MVNFFTGLLTLILAGLSFFIIFLILIQRTSGGLGSSMSTSVNSTFGGQTNKVLTRTTIYAVVSFFALSFTLYLLMLANPKTSSLHLPNVEASTPASLTDLTPASPASEVEANEAS